MWEALGRVSTSGDFLKAQRNEWKENQLLDSEVGNAGPQTWPLSKVHLKFECCDSLASDLPTVAH